MSAHPKIDDDRVLVITRDLDAPRALVWAAWIDFNHARNWMGPPGHPMKSMQNASPCPERRTPAQERWA